MRWCSGMGARPSPLLVVELDSARWCYWWVKELDTARRMCDAGAGLGTLPSGALPALDSARGLHGEGGPILVHFVQNRPLVWSAAPLSWQGVETDFVGFTVRHFAARHGGMCCSCSTKWVLPRRTRRRWLTRAVPSLILGAVSVSGWWPSSSMAGACAATGACDGSNIDVGVQCRMG